MMRFSALAGLLLIACVSCKDTPDKKKAPAAKTAVTPPPAPRTDLGPQVTGDLQALLNAYYELKDALVATDPAKADAAASRVMSAGETLHNELPADMRDRVAAGRYMDTIMNESEAIVNVKDETCEKKRAHFEHVSDAVFGFARLAGLKNGGVYRQYCPMAFNDKGAYWLSNEEEIRNPYFGKKMLECGEVRDSL